jgi:hypothetical protein
MPGTNLKSRLAIKTIVIGLMAALIIAFVSRLPRKTHVNVGGVVLDGNTGEPIANARVIVTLVRNGFPYDSYIGYGVVTDDNGNFELNTATSRAFNSIFIEASTPADQYAKVNAKDDERLVLRTSPLPQNKINSPRLRYARFRGLAAFGNGNELNFVGESW